jgi:hypothetical protein
MLTNKPEYTLEAALHHAHHESEGSVLIGKIAATERITSSISYFSSVQPQYNEISLLKFTTETCQ